MQITLHNFGAWGRVRIISTSAKCYSLFLGKYIAAVRVLLGLSGQNNMSMRVAAHPSGQSSYTNIIWERNRRALPKVSNKGLHVLFSNSSKSDMEGILRINIPLYWSVQYSRGGRRHELNIQCRIHVFFAQEARCQFTEIRNGRESCGSRGLNNTKHVTGTPYLGAIMVEGFHNW